MKNTKYYFIKSIHSFTVVEKVEKGQTTEIDNCHRNKFLEI
jgi:hypothetical protein